MELDVQQIGKNVVTQIETLRQQKEKLESQLREKLAFVNAELIALEKLAGIRKKPGRRSSSDVSRETNTSTSEKSRTEVLIEMATSILGSYVGEAFTSSEITNMVIKTGLWENPPKSAKANMGRALANLPINSTIQKTDDKRFFIQEEGDFS